MPPEPDSTEGSPSPAGLRVLQAMSGAGVGGIETFFFDGVEALHEAGLIQHVVIRPNVPAHQIARLERLGIGFTTPGFNKYWSWPTRRAFARLRERFKPNLAQFWTGRAARFAVRAPGLANIGWFGGYRQMKDFRACDDFIGITPDMMRHLKESGADPARSVRVHTFSALETAAPVARASLSTPADAPLLLILARLHPKKGIDMLLHALADVPGAYLWIAGEGPNRNEYEALTESLGLEGRVRFLGWREDRASLLAAADICVMPSRYEPFGTVMAEAWAARVPLIVAAAQGPLAYVKDGVNALMVPIDDAKALARAIARAIADKDLRARIVEGGWQTFESDFTKAAYVRGTLAFYRAVLARMESSTA